MFWKIRLLISEASACQRVLGSFPHGSVPSVQKRVWCRGRPASASDLQACHGGRVHGRRAGPGARGISATIALCLRTVHHRLVSMKVNEFSHFDRRNTHRSRRIVNVMTFLKIKSNRHLQVVENALNALESFVSRCSKDIAPHFDELCTVTYAALLLRAG